MGTVNLPSVEPQGNKTPEEYIRYIANILAMFQDDLQNILEGRLSANNILAESIETKNLKAGAITTDKIAAGAVIADKIDVNQLSAISADMGHITAGLIEAVNMIGSVITGSKIQTAIAGTYPRIQLDSSANLLSAEYAAANTVEIKPEATTGNPGIRFDKGLVGATIYCSSVATGGIDALKIVSNPGFAHTEINAGIDLILKAAGSILLDSWSKLKNNGTSQTLQQALDSKASTFTGYTGGIPAGASLICSNGIVVSYF